MLIARTEALTVGRDVNESLSRAASYVAAGADAVLIQTTAKDGNDILEFAAR